MLGDGRIDNLAAVGLQRLQRPDLIGTHQSRITGNIGRQHGSQPALHPLACHKIVSNFALPAPI
jgi:hypothetical protein